MSTPDAIQDFIDTSDATIETCRLRFPEFATPFQAFEDLKTPCVEAQVEEPEWDPWEGVRGV